MVHSWNNSKPEKFLELNPSAYDDELAEDQLRQESLCDIPLPARPTRLEANPTRLKAKPVENIVSDQTLDSVFHELSTIVQLYKHNEHSCSDRGRVIDFITGSKDVLGAFSPEKAGEICRHLVFLLQREELQGLHQELLALGYLASHVRQRDVVINDLATDELKRVGEYRNSVVTFRELLNEQVQLYQDGPLRHFSDMDDVSLAARVTATAIGLDGRSLTVPRGEKPQSPMFIRGCDLLVLGAQSQGEQLLVLKALFNSCAQPLLADPFCDKAQSSRRHFIRSFDSAISQFSTSDFIDETTNSVVSDMCQALWGNASAHDRRANLMAVNDRVDEALEGRFLRLDTVRKVNALTDDFLEPHMKGEHAGLVSALADPMMF